MQCIKTTPTPTFLPHPSIPLPESLSHALVHSFVSCFLRRVPFHIYTANFYYLIKRDI